MIQYYEEKWLFLNPKSKLSKLLGAKQIKAAKIIEAVGSFY